MKYLWKYSIFLILLTACEPKEEAADNWQNCFDCNKEDWLGTYEGKCEFYNAVSNIRTYDLPITIEFEETGTDYFTATIEVPNYYYATISGEWVNNSNISFAGSNSSVSCNLYFKDNSLKVSGNSKKFYIKVDNVVIEKVINFNILKEQ